MKSIFTLRVILLGLFLLGLSMIGNTSQVSAQASSLVDELYAVPQGSFVSQQEASARIDNSVSFLKSVMETLNQSSPEYKETSAKYAYYIAMQELFNNGKTVPVSIAEGLHTVAAPDTYGLTRSKLMSLKQEAISLLRP